MIKSHVNYFIFGGLSINTDKFAMASNYFSDYLNMLNSNSDASLITKPTKLSNTLKSHYNRSRPY